MIRNYFKIALRTLGKHKAYTAINVGGLAIGMAVCLLIALFVRNEWSYDRFHDDADRLYRAWVYEDYGEGNIHFNSATPLPLGPALEEHFPEVEAFTRVFQFPNLVEHDNARFNETLSLVDVNFFEMFDFELLRGTPEAVFTDLNTVVLTESVAARYFGAEDPIGQTLSIRLGQDAFEDFVVTGLAADPPTNTSITPGILMPFAKGDNIIWSMRAYQAWMNVTPETYVRLRADVTAEEMMDKMPTMVANVLGDQVQPGQYQVGLQPITDIHLNPDIPQGISPVSDPSYSYILAAIALFILLIACINFVMLSLGRSAARATEVGVRKVVGADRRHLMAQFWGEALLLTALALLLGLALAQVLLPLFNDLAGQTLTLRPDLGLMLVMIGLLAVVGLLSGIYPALVLSSFRPIEVLKGTLSVGRDAGLLGRSLIVIQFGLAIFLIASTLIMGQQHRYLQDKNLGFEQEQVVVIPTGLPAPDGMALIERFRSEASTHPGVVQVAGARFTFGAGTWFKAGYTADDATYRTFMLNLVDHDYLETLGVQMAEGRGFSRDVPADATMGIVVNEAMVTEYGWEDPLAARLPGGFGDHQIIGVVKDFNYESLHTPVGPLLLAINFAPIQQGLSDANVGQSMQPKIFVRIQPTDVPATLEALAATWARVAPDQDYAFSFLDAAVEQQYRQEERLGRMVGIASMLAILIACLGLFGLAALTVVRRTKEIGVRKVMGASAGQILMLLSREFTILVVIGFVLALPATYFFIDPWLDDFAYRIAVRPGPFMLAGLLAVGVAWLTVAYQSLRAARSNPVDALRYE